MGAERQVFWKKNVEAHAPHAFKFWSRTEEYMRTMPRWIAPSIIQHLCTVFWSKYIVLHDIVVLNTAICCKYEKKYEMKSDKSNEIQWSNGRKTMTKWEEDSQEPIVNKCVKIFFVFLSLIENSCTDGSNYVPIL